jgi:hypothetical protein
VAEGAVPEGHQLLEEASQVDGLLLARLIRSEGAHPVEELETPGRARVLLLEEGGDRTGHRIGVLPAAGELEALAEKP